MSGHADKIVASEVPAKAPGLRLKGDRVLFVENAGRELPTLECAFRPLPERCIDAVALHGNIPHYLADLVEYNTGLGVEDLNYSLLSLLFGRFTERRLGCKVEHGSAAVMTRVC